jgi:hypothetical protein
MREVAGVVKDQMENKPYSVSGRDALEEGWYNGVGLGSGGPALLHIYVLIRAIPGMKYRKCGIFWSVWLRHITRSAFVTV